MRGNLGIVFDADLIGFAVNGDFGRSGLDAADLDVELRITNRNINLEVRHPVFAFFASVPTVLDTVRSCRPWLIFLNPSQAYKLVIRSQAAAPLPNGRIQTLLTVAADIIILGIPKQGRHEGIPGRQYGRQGYQTNATTAASGSGTQNSRTALKPSKGRKIQ